VVNVGRNEWIVVFRRLLRYLKPYQKRFWLAFAALLAGSGAEVTVPLLVSHYLNEYLVPGRFDLAVLIVYGLGILLLQSVAAAFDYYQMLSFQTVAQWVVRSLRKDVFSHVQRLGLRFYDQVPGGSLVSRITNDTEAVKDFYVHVLASFLQNTVFILFVFAGMFWLDVTLASWLTLVLPVIFWLMKKYRDLSSPSYRESRHQLSRMNAKLNDSIAGMNIIQAFLQERRFIREFSRINELHYRAGMRNIRFFALMLRPATQFLSVAATVAVLLYFGFVSRDGAVQLGILYGFLNLIERIFEPVNEIMMRLSPLQQSLTAAERVFELMDQKEFAPGKEGDSSPEIKKGHIRFDHVSFSYDGKTDVLKNITFEVKPGQTVALVGHTGSGKSSIIHLLMRFYRVKSGEIFIDGVPLRFYDNGELRQKIGLVMQEPFLFAGDVTGNIRLHHPMSEEQVKKAARFVQADAFIEKLPRAWEEPVVERGATLSGGQRQLISFARTMAMEPKILLLDEATAHVDTETEEAIQTALKRMHRDRTTLVIAHRLSTVQDADLILVLHEGEIVERGTHQELMAREGLYRKMYRLQKGGSSFLRPR
jgi:ATP-binding cassette, subfamily B, multidrug efflux pump